MAKIVEKADRRGSDPAAGAAATASYKWFVLAVTGVGTFCSALDISVNT